MLLVEYSPSITTILLFTLICDMISFIINGDGNLLPRSDGRTRETEPEREREIEREGEREEEIEEERDGISYIYNVFHNSMVVLLLLKLL